LHSIRYNYKYNQLNQQQQAVAHDSTGTRECKKSIQPNITQCLARVGYNELLGLSQCRNFINSLQTKTTKTHA